MDQQVYKRVDKTGHTTTTKVNTVTTKTNILEQCLNKIDQRFDVIDRQQERSFQNMQHNINQDQEQFAQETQKKHEDLKIWMMQQWGNIGPEEEEPSSPTTLVIPSTSKRSRDTNTLTQSTYETSNLTEEI